MRSPKLFLVLTLLLLLGALVYIPGLDGPYFFDDYSNLLGNAYVRVGSLDPSTLYQAAFSMSAGPLQRPIAMLSFAVNYYIAGGFDNVFAFKLINVVLHIGNGLLIYWLTFLILKEVSAKRRSTKKAESTLIIGAGVVSLLWLVHPLQLSSVLYVVQRMTELAATFTLLGLIAYMRARLFFRGGQWRSGVVALCLAFGLFWPLGLYSKEIALLLPVFMVVIDYTIFARDWPWVRWQTLSRTVRYTILACSVVAAVLCLVGVMLYALPGYSSRNFTMLERVLTQPRILFFYISLILVPRLDALGLFHDDIPISTSMLSPWTTLPAMIGIVTLPIIAVLARKRYPLLSLGVFWFLAGHLLESTVFSLEMVYEHRNYLPLLGILLVLCEAFRRAYAHLNPNILRLTTATAVIGFAAITAVRASQWSSEPNMAYYEAMHHPNSAASQSRYANFLLSAGRFNESLIVARRAAELSPDEPSHLIGIIAVTVPRGGKVNVDDDETIRRLLASRPISASTLYELMEISNCVTRNCPMLQPYLQGWTEAMLKNPNAHDVSYTYFLLGRALLGQEKTDEAVEAYKKSYELDAEFVHPLLDLVELYLYYGRSDFAEIILTQIRVVNARSVHKRDKEIARLSQKISEQKARRAERVRN